MARNWKKIYEEFLESLPTETLKASYGHHPVLESMNRLKLDGWNAYKWYYGQGRATEKELLQCQK